MDTPTNSVQINFRTKVQIPRKRTVCRCYMVKFVFRFTGIRLKMHIGYLVLVFVLAHCKYALSSANLPCEYVTSSLSQYAIDDNPSFQCKTIYLEIPTNFDATKIPENVTVLELSHPFNWKCGFGYSQTSDICNVLKTTAPPFPAQPQLRTIVFHGFQGEGGARFSVNKLLDNAKPYLNKLFIHSSVIGSLDTEYFKGFSVLEELNLEQNDISDIAVNTFQSLSSTRPVLRSLTLGYNRIQSFDFAVFQPVADSLSTFSLSTQMPALHTLHRSSPKFSLKNMTELKLDSNNLSSIPNEVFETLDSFPHDHVVFEFTSNSFCPTDKSCSCCGFKELQNWMGRVNQTSRDGQEFEFLLECGIDSPHGTGSYKYNPKITKTQGKWRVQETKADSPTDIGDLSSYPNKAIC